VNQPAEVTQVHTRLLKCSLDLEESRAYWHHSTVSPITAERAFTEYWFGARSLPRVALLLTNFRARFDAYPAALAVLQRWPDMDLATRRAICHWHLQLSDPLYRAFTGTYLLARHRPHVSRDAVIAWVGEQGPGRWTMATQIQFASKLLTAANAAGLVIGIRDPRPLAVPPIPNDALAYLLHLLRDLQFTGTLLDNPYLASVGLTGPELDARLRALDTLTFRRQGALVELEWAYADLRTWAQARHPALAEASA
jgi:hypothetical protein